MEMLIFSISIKITLVPLRYKLKRTVDILAENNKNQKMQKEQLHPTTIVISTSCYDNGNLYFWSQGLFYSETEVNAYAEYSVTAMKLFPFNKKEKNP